MKRPTHIMPPTDGRRRARPAVRVGTGLPTIPVRAMVPTTTAAFVAGGSS